MRFKRFNLFQILGIVPGTQSMLVIIIPVGIYYYSQRYVINCGRDANLECWESTLKPVKGLQASGRPEGTDYGEAHFKRKRSCLNEGE